ncbi:MAG: ROK family glucokinase [Oscillospiraceae bacterium]|nr:ROK family glucokinase [Oscillospiraceae bacterium]
MLDVGIDLGGTNIKVGIVDSEFKIIAKTSIKTDMPKPVEQIVDNIANCVVNLCDLNDVKFDNIDTIGIGSPGNVNSKTGVVLNAANLNFKNTPLGELLSQKLGRKVTVENDANAAAYGEYLAGAGVGFKDLTVITLGTGVGGGIIINGKIHNGFGFCGGELGHMVLEKDGVPCNCGRKGCIEVYCSATALKRMTADALKDNPQSRIKDFSIQEISGKTAFEAMKIGDETATRVVKRYLDYLGCAVTNIVNLLQPELILIGGGICKEGDFIIKPLTEYVMREAFYIDRENGAFTKIAAAKLGNDAGIIGASKIRKGHI